MKTKYLFFVIIIVSVMVNGCGINYVSDDLRSELENIANDARKYYKNNNTFEGWDIPEEFKYTTFYRHKAEPKNRAIIILTYRNHYADEPSYRSVITKDSLYIVALIKW